MTLMEMFMSHELITRLHELSVKLRNSGDTDACILVEKAYDTIFRQYSELDNYEHRLEMWRLTQKAGKYNAIR